MTSGVLWAPAPGTRAGPQGFRRRASALLAPPPHPADLHTQTHYWSHHGASLHVIDRPERDTQLVFCALLLLVITAASRNVMQRVASRADVAVVTGGVLLLNYCNGGVVPPHIAAVETAAAVVLGAVVGAAVSTSLDPSLRIEPFRCTMEAAACAAVAAAFPHSLAGPGPAQLVSLLCGCAIIAVAGRARSAAAAPAVVWSVAALVYPTVVDAHVSRPDDYLANVALAILLCSVIFVVSAQWQRGPESGTPPPPQAGQPAT